MDQEDRKKLKFLMLRPWLSFQQAAEYLGISRASIYRLFHKKELVPNGLIAGKKRFSRTYLDRVVRANAKEVYPESERFDVEKTEQAPKNEASLHLHDRQRAFSGENSAHRRPHRSQGAAPTNRSGEPRRRAEHVQPDDTRDTALKSTTDFKAEIMRLRKELA